MWVMKRARKNRRYTEGVQRVRGDMPTSWGAEHGCGLTCVVDNDANTLRAFRFISSSSSQFNLCLLYVMLAHLWERWVLSLCDSPCVLPWLICCCFLDVFTALSLSLLITRSDGNVCELLTITDFTSDPEAIGSRPVAVITARIHPGEANSSWVMKVCWCSAVTGV